jgi:geranylgeranyl diphosphate synthase, type II
MKSFDEITQLVSGEINKLDWTKEPQGLYAPIAYVLSLGGKRIRPAMTLMACELFNNDLQLAIAPALGIEVFHNFTLLHDDIMDKAPIRRSKPTVHVKWDDNTAILSGDVMQIAAYQLISKTPDQYLKQVLDLFSNTAAEICEGQQLDVEFEHRDKVDADEYLEMIRLKTAVLLGCSFKTGAIVGGASVSEAELLYNFGVNIGLAFQLKDDLLDVYGNEATFGKKIGGDILCNKKTFLLIHALEMANGEIKEELLRWLKIEDYRADDKIIAVTNIYNILGVKKICEDKMSFFYEKAVANLNELVVDDNKKQELRKLAQKLMSRND